jgi:hypothetical protein
MPATIASLTLALAALSTPVAPAPTPADAAPAAAVYGWIDPETGRSAPMPAAEIAELESELADWSLEQALRTDSEGLVVESDAFGVLTVDLQGRFMSAVYGRIDADGTAVVDDDPSILASDQP